MFPQGRPSVFERTVSHHLDNTLAGASARKREKRIAVIAGVIFCRCLAAESMTHRSKAEGASAGLPDIEHGAGKKPVLPASSGQPPGKKKERRNRGEANSRRSVRT